MRGSAAIGRPLKVKMISPAKTAADSVYWRSIKYSLFPPLGLATLAGYLDEDDEIDLQDEHVEKLRLDDEPDLVVRVEIAGQGGEAERREQRVLDGAPVDAVGGRLRRRDQLHLERPPTRGPAAHQPAPSSSSAKRSSSTSRPLAKSAGWSQLASCSPTRRRFG